MGRLMLNCDLGENESAARTEELLALVDAANICCGVHAGSPAKTRATIAAAHQAGVKVGIHPGLAEAGGRGLKVPSPEDFADLLEGQVHDFLSYATALRCPVHHIKLHGTLYSAVEQDMGLAEVYIRFLENLPQLQVFVLAGGQLSQRLPQAVPELFVDRAYRLDGNLVPRIEAGALIEDVDVAMARLRKWQGSGKMPTCGGGVVDLEARTICVHSDSVRARHLLEAIKAFQG